MKRIEQGTLFPADGSPAKIVTPADGKKFSLDELQKFVGGYIESIVCVKPYVRAFVNEEGAIKGDLQDNPHTWSVLNRKVYALNGYAEGFRVSGDIIAVQLVQA
jgi:hypothetical protein